jgi:hypothetical protein
MASMARLTFTQEKKERALLRLEAGCAFKDVSCEFGVSVRTLYRWRTNTAQKQECTEDRERLRCLEAQHRRLQKQFAELSLDYITLRAALMKEVRGDC